ncbi:CaiB/BaiF CoA transferase family protein [Eilatimonas milleporae]|uniref:Crotonobetainyl-CoA:carnitine CoA-transferase CaiB-like acyl-CoA transferase n=1 Tax=Eilatimonas milleporae TaxID=911205 RepID=A0A3M0C4I3_9PROT|nr:CoA transferase [Eilatimonas milleporae]RMB04761.1 crotonobetainyl-CoA:carnitine CoA-transferase CaiB-like acyl-CoA transferase [Eilatimonas milleporae]
MPATTILSDITITDMTSFVFGPYCTQTLADMGANVIKVETEKGDIMRIAGKPANTRKMGPHHMTFSRGKRSVVFDLKEDWGKEAIRRLIKNSDIFIHNALPAGMKRKGLGFEDVRSIKKDIVYVECVGFGTDGPYAGRPAFDDIIQGYSGMASLLPRLDGNERPRFLPMLLADKVSGLHAVHATLAALRQRDKTGEAQHVEVPMLECSTSFLLQDHFDEAVFDPPTGSFGFTRSFDTTLQPMKTKDGWMMIAPYTDDRWIKTFQVLGAPHELEDEQLNDRKKRYYNKEYMHERVQIYLEKETTDHWLKAFDAAKIPVGRINDLEALRRDPHLVATKFFQRREHPTEGAFWEMQPPVRFHNSEEKEINPAPLLGQHTAEVLDELGLDPPPQKD